MQKPNPPLTPWHCLDADSFDLPLRMQKPTWYELPDVFAEEVSESTIRDIFEVMGQCQSHIYALVTGNIERADHYMGIGLGWHGENIVDQLWGKIDLDTWKWPLSNLLLGVRISTQEEADAMLPILNTVPAAGWWLKLTPREPLAIPATLWGGTLWTSLYRWFYIEGGEEPLHPDWVRSLIAQAECASVPVEFSSWGEWQNGSARDVENLIVYSTGLKLTNEEFCAARETNYSGLSEHHCHGNPCAMARVGRAASGCALDGREWHERPRIGEGGF
jgi:protein gp37